MSAAEPLFPCVRVEGSVLPADLLRRVAAADRDLGGLRPEDYGLGFKPLNEAVAQAWADLLPAWKRFDRDRAAKNAAAAWTQALWQALGYGRLDAVPGGGFVIENKTYPISQVRYRSPFHLVPPSQGLDARVETPDGKRPSPHAVLQEFLNRSEAHLWGFACNGLALRVLRDNVRLTRQSFLEFDLAGLFGEEKYADFALLYRLCHESRVNPLTPDNPADCWLERWSKKAADLGVRALDALRRGVESAVEALGRGFLHHRNEKLLSWLRAAQGNSREYYRQLLRVVYRLLFLFVAEDRELLHGPGVADDAKARYADFYSTSRLRRLALSVRGTAHVDLYHGLGLVLRALGNGGCPGLGLVELGGLFDPAGTPDLGGCVVANADLLDAVRALCVVSDGRAQRAVDYRNLGSEELGSVYEGLLELRPEFLADPPTFELKSAAGNDRKTTGSYYTPTSLITCLLDSALDPVLAEAAAKPDPESAILALKVCDPAAGSGHFLIAAAHRIAKRLAAVRTGDEEADPREVRRALREVIGRCVYGVDINPMAVELCQVALWMEAMEPGKPLGFLKSHIRCGNALLGATPALIAGGIPDAAFEPIEGDDRAYCGQWKKRNKEAREGQGLLFDDESDDFPHLGDLEVAHDDLDAMPDETADQVRAKDDAYAEIRAEANYRKFGGLLADVWCAAFVWRKTDAFDYPVTQRIVSQVRHNPHDVTPWMFDEVRRLARQYQFFHWHVEFPAVFRRPKTGERADNELMGWRGGFDVVLGNPPWERIKLQEQEWFTAHGRADIAGAKTAAIRGRMIQALRGESPPLYAAFLEDRRVSEGESHLVRDTGRFPLCGRGDVNTYSVFAELNRNLISPTGRVGCIVPTGIATDDTTKVFFGDLVKQGSLVSLLSFFEIRLLFTATDSRNPFCLLTLTGEDRPAESATFVCDARRIEDFTSPDKRFTLSPADFALLNPNTRTCPVFRTAADAVLTKAVYRRADVLVRDDPASNPWGVRFLRMLDMANDSGLFRTAEQLAEDGWTLDGNVFRKGDGAMLPMYEAKMLHQYDHRWASFDGTDSRDITLEEKADPSRLALPRYWVPSKNVDDRLSGRWEREWLLGWRDICRNTDIRTAIAGIIPRVGVGHTAPIILPEGSPAALCGLYSSITSFVFDYVVRQKVGGTHLTFGLFNQLPVLPPSTYAAACPWSPSQTVADWLLPRVVELTYTANDLRPFAADCGYDGEPFRWDNDRRRQLRAELDAAFFRLYLGGDAWTQAAGEPDTDFARLREAFPTPRHAVEYVMDTFPIVKRNDIDAHGNYRTAEAILSAFDAMASGAYESPLDPPAGVREDEGPLRGPALDLFGHPLGEPKLRETIIEAFAGVHDGYSTEYVVCHPVYEGKFHDLAERLILARGLKPIGAKEINAELWNARRSGKLKDHHSTKRYNAPKGLEDVEFVCEWAFRSVASTFAKQTGTPPKNGTLERFLCDPEWRKRFDERVKNLYPDFDVLDWRMLAMRIRKRTDVLKTAPFSLFDDRRDIADLSGLTEKAGHYLIGTAGGVVLYTGFARNLRASAKRMEAAGGGVILSANAVDGLGAAAWFAIDVKSAPHPSDTWRANIKEYQPVLNLFEVGA